MTFVPVHTGDTLSGIAAEHGVSLSQLEASNPQFSDPNLIYTGQQVTLPSGTTATISAPPSSEPSEPAPVRNPATPSSVPATTTPVHTSYSGSSGGGLSDVPGVPSGFASCVAYRESTDLQNPAANGNAYGIIPASGYNVAGDSLAQQKQVFRQIYDTAGPSAWAADGCPGT